MINIHQFDRNRFGKMGSDNPDDSSTSDESDNPDDNPFNFLDNPDRCTFDIESLDAAQREDVSPSGSGNNMTVRKRCLTEAEMTKERLWNFDSSKSKAVMLWKVLFPCRSHKQDLYYANLLCHRSNGELKLDRLAKRVRRVFMKWLDENWGKIWPILVVVQATNRCLTS